MSDEYYPGEKPEEYDTRLSEFGPEEQQDLYDDFLKCLDSNQVKNVYEGLGYKYFWTQEAFLDWLEQEVDRRVAKRKDFINASRDELKINKR